MSFHVPLLGAPEKQTSHCFLLLWGVSQFPFGCIPSLSKPHGGKASKEANITLVFLVGLNVFNMAERALGWKRRMKTLTIFAQDVRQEFQKDAHHDDTWTQHHPWAPRNNVDVSISLLFVVDIG